MFLVCDHQCTLNHTHVPTCHHHIINHGRKWGLGTYLLLIYYIDGLGQEGCNFIANALELCLSCSNPSIQTAPHLISLTNLLFHRLNGLEVKWREDPSFASLTFCAVNPHLVSSYSTGYSTGCLTHWGQDKMAAISKTVFSNAFSWMEIYEFRSKFHWSLFLRVQLTIFQYWFR